MFDLVIFFKKTIQSLDHFLYILKFTIFLNKRKKFSLSVDIFPIRFNMYYDILTMSSYIHANNYESTT